MTKIESERSGFHPWYKTPRTIRRIPKKIGCRGTEMATPTEIKNCERSKPVLFFFILLQREIVYFMKKSKDQEFEILCRSYADTTA